MSETKSITPEQIANHVRQFPNFICFFADHNKTNRAVLSGGHLVNGDIDIIGNYMVSKLAEDDKLFSIFKQIVTHAENERRRTLKPKI